MKRSLLLIPLLAMAAMAADVSAQNSRPRVVNPPRTSTGPRDQFAAAKKLFDAGSYNQALPQFESLLRQYPQFPPALIYYAKTLYRVDRIPESFQYFSRTDVNQLDITTSYEYGMAFFWMRQYEGALVAFRRVPAGHSLSDLANYYGGIAAMKMRFYADAEAMMEKAIVLPTKLSKSRTLYLKHIKELKLLQEKEALAYERKIEKERMQTAIKNANPAKEPESSRTKRKPAPATSADKKDTAAVTKTPDKPAVYAHQGFLVVDKGAFLAAGYKSQDQDYHGYARKKSETQTTAFTFKGGRIFGFEPTKPEARQSAFGFQLDLKAERNFTAGDGERRNIVTDTDDDIQRIQAGDPEKSITRVGSFAARPWLEFALPEDVWIGAGGAITSRYPDFETKGRTGSYNGYLRVGRKLKPLAYSAKYNFLEIVDEENRPTMATHTGSAILNYNVEQFYIDADITYDSYQYLKEGIDGPSTVTGASADNYLSLPLGFYLGVFLSGQYQTENIVHALPTYGDVSADGVVYTGKFYLLANPISWFVAEINQQVQKSQWQVTPEEAQDTYERNQLDFLETFEAKASINLLF